VGVDDGKFKFRGYKDHAKEKTLLAAVLLQDHRVVTLRLGKITVDGFDATATLNRLLAGLEFDIVLLSGVSFGGFNLIDPHAIYRRFLKPVVIVSGRRPNNQTVKRALITHFDDWRKRWAVIHKLGPIHQIRSAATESPVFFEVVGTSVKRARRLIRDSAWLGRLPEAVRIAGLVAKGLST
jgi:endonuclease V-like protein UPF0215 family